METRSMTRRKDEEIRKRTSSNMSSTSSDDFMALDYKLHQVFLKFHGYLNVIHLNAQSIPGHWLEFLATFSAAHFIDAILVSETFLKPNMQSTDYELPGFWLLRNDREGKPGGGVAIYLRKGIGFNVVTRSPGIYQKSAEHLFIEIFPNEVKVLLGVYYSPHPTIDYFSSFQSLLNNLRSEYDHVLLLGDFNTCLLKENKRKKQLETILNSNRLYIPNKLRPTHYAPKTKPSLLDLIIVSDLHKVAKHGQLTGCFSYHDVLFLSYEILSPKQNLCSSFVMERATSSTAPIPTWLVVEPLWRTKDYQEARAKQLKAKRKLKKTRTDSVLIEYQISTKDVKKLERKHKNEKIRIHISRQTRRKTVCYICEPRSKTR